MAAERRREDRARRLARERALYQYSSALERGDFETVAEMLHQAETDEALEQMILEVNDTFGAELAGEPAVSRVDGRRMSLAARWAPRRRHRATERRRRGGDMGDTKGSSKRRPLLRGRRLSPGLIAGAVVAVVVVACLGTWILQPRSYFGSWPSASEGVDEAAPDVAWDVAEKRAAVGSLAAPALVSGGGEVETPASEAGERNYLGSDGEPVVAQEAPRERLIVRTGSLTLRVEDTLAARQAIEDLVARLAGEGAFVVSSEQRGGDGGEDPYISMAVRVPAARFGEAMDAIADLAVDVVSRTENADDVTEEYVDLAGRLEALEAARDRLLEIMSEADRTEDLLQAEEQLTRREAEIEATQGRMQYLAQSAALARIWVELQPYVLSQPVGQRWRPAETVREAQDALVDGAQGLADFVLFFGIAVLPWLLALGLGLYLLYRFVRWTVRRRRARQPGEGSEPGA
jgi:hypothetical protein